MSSVMLLVGTKKGAFLLQSDEARDKWDVSPPLCDHWPVTHVNYDPATKTILAAAGSEWFGHAIWRSNDMGATWTHSSAGLEYAEGEPPVTAAWNVTPANGALYAGVNPAGLFKSTDGGETWAEMRGLREAPGRDAWMEGGAGLILHTIVPHPSDPAKMYIAISAGGMYATEDGGETWEPRNRGIRASFMPEEQQRTAIAGFCCHRIVLSSGDPDFIFQQNHEGMYRSADAGHSWTEVSAGLPSDFGFATAAHPHQDKTFFVAPLTDPMNGRYMHNGEVAIWRTKDAGDTWERKTEGLPSSNAYLSVLRGAMDTDTLGQAGVYFGAANGTVYGSTDDGESWREIVTGLPPILVGGSRRAALMAVVLLRSSLTNLFPGLERRIEVPATTVLGAINAIESLCPGFRARVCDSTPAIRRHIRVFVDAELATLGTELGERSQVEIIPAISGG